MKYPVIRVNQAGKQFRRFPSKHSPTFKEWIIRGCRLRRTQNRFWALQDISFSVAPGCVLGIIGTNGSGKSTLLQLIGGIFPPDAGSLQVQGRIGALTDLGAGFHRDLSGRENIFIYGSIAGLAHSEIKERFDSIVSFAELEDFIDSPYRTYSSGMQMRLSFSAAVHTNPEIMLIDEVLAVGDLNFQNKCFERMAAFKQQGCTMIIVSHELEKIRKLCDVALWLRHGELAAIGEPASVIEQYCDACMQETRLRIPVQASPGRSPNGIELRLNENRFGSLEMEIISVRLLNGAEQQVEQLESGAAICIEIEYMAQQPVEGPIFEVLISNDERSDFVDINTAASGVALASVQGRGKLRLQLERLDLQPGRYYVNCIIYEKNWEYQYDSQWHVYPITIQSKTNSKGVLAPPHRWELANST